MFYVRYVRLFRIYTKKHGEKTVNPSIRINIDEIENRITFKIKTGYYLELLTPETMTLLGSTKSKITKNGNGGNEESNAIIFRFSLTWHHTKYQTMKFYLLYLQNAKRNEK